MKPHEEQVSVVVIALGWIISAGGLILMLLMVSKKEKDAKTLYLNVSVCLIYARFVLWLF